MRYLMTVCISLFVSVQLMGQTYNSYKLDKYVNPDYKRKSLDFKVDMNGSITSLKDTGGSSYVYENDRQNIEGNLGISYYMKKNTVRTQRSTMFGVNFSGGFKHDNNYDLPNETSRIDYKDRSASIRAFFHQKSYHYFNPEKALFLAFTPYVNLYFDKRNEKYKADLYSMKDKNDKFFLFSYINIGVGKGRIENVEDARLAVYLLDDLQKKGLINQVLSDAEVDEFAKVITLAKNKRQFDSRVRLIEEITKVDSFLVANGYVEEHNGSAYYTSIYDKWQYAGVVERLSGTRFTVGVSPGFNFHRSNYSKDDHFANYSDHTAIEGGSYRTPDWKNISSSFKGSVYAEFTCEKPMNLYWQRSAGAVASFFLEDRRHHESTIKGATFETYFRMGYYPNSRTYITGSIGQDFNWDDGADIFMSNTRLSFDLYYYLSPQLRLSGNYELSYGFTRFIELDNNVFNKYPNNSLNVALTYSFF